MKIERYLNGSLVEVLDNRTLQEAKTEKVNFIREIASIQIKNSGLDEATQQNAALGIYSPERCEAIKSYISACRHEYLRCKGLILAAQTNDEADEVKFVAPPVPEGL
jgi:hypothetical protein